MATTMHGMFRPTINLGNSIIGVSILAMPYCLKECGLILGVVLLTVSALLTIWSCKMLVRAASSQRKYSYEYLALSLYGHIGKLAVELSVIGLSLGTCIAFFVIIGDLAPPIVASATGISMSPASLRALVLIIMAVCVALPLALLRNVDSLSAISAASFIFYSMLIVEILFYAFDRIRVREVWAGNIEPWQMKEVWVVMDMWRWQGILKCLPIFSLAFACHTTLFVIYGAVADPTIRKMSSIINGAVITVAIGYSLVAVFGYISFYSDGVKGDVLSNFPMTFMAQLTRFGFSVTVLVSFPLIIFPCRASINTLLFSKGPPGELHVAEPIPRKRFNAITVCIIFSTLTVAILIPQVETVLAFTGATMGSLICYIFPATLFLSATKGAPSEYRTRAKVILGLGLGIMIMSTVVILGTPSDNGGEVTFPRNPIPKPNTVDSIAWADTRGKDMDSLGDGKAVQVGHEGADPADGEKRLEPPEPQDPAVVLKLTEQETEERERERGKLELAEQEQKLKLAEQEQEREREKSKLAEQEQKLKLAEQEQKLKLAEQEREREKEKSKLAEQEQKLKLAEQEREQEREKLKHTEQERERESEKLKLAEQDQKERKSEEVLRGKEEGARVEKEVAGPGGEGAGPGREGVGPEREGAGAGADGAGPGGEENQKLHEDIDNLAERLNLVEHENRELKERQSQIEQQRPEAIEAAPGDGGKGGVEKEKRSPETQPRGQVVAQDDGPRAAAADTNAERGAVDDAPVQDSVPPSPPLGEEQLKLSPPEAGKEVEGNIPVANPAEGGGAAGEGGGAARVNGAATDKDGVLDKKDGTAVEVGGAGMNGGGGGGGGNEVKRQERDTREVGQGLHKDEAAAAMVAATETDLGPETALHANSTTGDRHSEADNPHQDAISDKVERELVSPDRKLKDVDEPDAMGNAVRQGRELKHVGDR